MTIQELKHVQTDTAYQSIIDILIANGPHAEGIRKAFTPEGKPLTTTAIKKSLIMKSTIEQVGDYYVWKFSDNGFKLEAKVSGVVIDDHYTTTVNF